jgi:hypothetical protein
VLRLFLIFLFSSINLFGYKITSKVGHVDEVVKIKKVIKFQDKNQKENYILFTENGAYKIQASNNFLTTKVAAYLKTQEGKSVKIVLHFNYNRLATGQIYQYSRVVCNAFSNEH